MIIDGGPVTPEELVAVARGDDDVRVESSVAEKMRPALEVVERAVDGDRIVYGITTGFGALASTRIDRSQAEELQVNLLRSHAAGVGNPLPDDVVRGMMALRARTLASGHSGVRPLVVEKILELLENGILPVVPELGSVGASGDLAPFAHLALPLIGEGEVRIGDQIVPSAQALAMRGITPLSLGPKEGLSLLNGTEGMTTMGCLGLVGGLTLVRAADVACAMTVESLYGSERPFREEIHRLRPHPGQTASAGRIKGVLADSEIGASHIDDFEHAVQDAYSLRCAPQVHGAVLDTLGHARNVLEIELGSVVDNPIVLSETDEVISGGNFHGQPLAFILDFMTIAITELGSISERRTDRILDPERSNGLPPFLSPHAGTHSGYMLTQYTAAAIVAENRVLSHPASVESIPTSGSQEDHVSMGWGAGRKLLTVLKHTIRVIAIEMLCAAQGIEYRELRPSPRTARFVELIRSEVPPLEGDRPPGVDIEAISSLIESGAFDRILADEELL
ncbi:MAG: histidine ammonia-lyase [Acidimicrobiia bacterium]|nr:histidine ammonia-lyase [Acidimicrobiia bacterium]